MKYIYLARIEGMNVYKIGFTKKNPKSRLESLQTGNPFRIVLVDSYRTQRATQIESILHRRYQTSKYKPEEDITLLGEWFVFEETEVRRFREICEQIDANLKIIEENSTLYN